MRYIGGSLLTGAGGLIFFASLSWLCVRKPHKKNDVDHSLETVIGSIKAARANGHRTALFIGRTHDQYIPEEKDWAWFSLDRVAGADNSHHLKMDFNHQKLMRKIGHLFDKVVVDFSVIKFFTGSPWDKLHSLLCTSTDSELIVESDKGIYEMGPNLQIHARLGDMIIPYFDTTKENEIFSTWCETVGKEQKEKEYASFLQGLSQKEIERETLPFNGSDVRLKIMFKQFILKRENLEPPQISYKKELLEAIRDYLLTRFHHVELKKGPYPYRSVERGDADVGTVSYWIVKHPK